ncbi:MAG: hypothetical protein E6H89_02040 [Chloroflexi bacterium]|nr:MAG: hypothetical protein E6H89_02040 [Chloroflexota bacterium]
MGLLSGNWIFAAKQAFDQPQPEAQIWAVPIAGGTPKLAFAYVVPGGGIPEAPIDNAPYLRRQFSPDGRRMVIAVNGQLVVVDLESGAARALGVKGTFPSWSRDGSRLAFLLTVPNPNAIGPDVSIATVAADGGAVHQLGLLTQAESLEWSVDGMNLLVPQQGRVSIVDVASGAVIRTIDVQSGPAPSFAHFRRGTPAVALALFGCVASRSLISLDAISAPIRTLVTSPGTGEQCLLALDPRWNPAADELLYVAAPMNALCCRPHVLDIASGKDAVIPVEAYQATWSADGSEIAYLTPSRAVGYGSTIRVWPRDGRNERVLLVVTGYDRLVSIASVAY